MSKNSLFQQPGVEQLVPGSELPVAVKVTGRNMHAVTLLASVSGEEAGLRTVVQSYFEKDGSLVNVSMVSPDGGLDVKAGDYLLLADDRKTLVVADEAELASIKATLPLVFAVAEAAKAFADVFGVNA